MNWLELVELDLSAEGEPMYARISRCIKEHIHSGRLKEEAKLPTNRELSRILKIDRSTVARAYSELCSAGLIERHVGRGTFVRRSSSRPTDSQRGIKQEIVPPGNLSWVERFSQASFALADLMRKQPAPANARADNISFAGGIPTEEFYPYDEFQNIVERILSSGQAKEMFGYSPAEGHTLLRQEVLAHLQAQGIEAADEELLIVSGSQQAIALVTEILIDPGDRVLLEDPSYFWAIGIFRTRRARCIPLPVDNDGVRLDAVEHNLRSERAKLIYVMPSFQNPTGASMTISRRKDLLDLARTFETPILEDNFVGDLYYDGERLPPLRALPGGKQLVIHQGTFSKALCPGLRLGWIVAPADVIARLSLAKRASDLSTNSMAQVVLAHYLQEGLYLTHLEHVRQAYRIRRDAMLNALEKHFGAGFAGMRPTWTKPHGGLFIWMKLPPALSARELLTHAELEGISFSPGELFFQTGDSGEYLRLCFIQTSPDLIEHGIERLSLALKRYVQLVLARNRSGYSRHNQDQVLI